MMVAAAPSAAACSSKNGTSAADRTSISEPRQHMALHRFMQMSLAASGVRPAMMWGNAHSREISGGGDGLRTIAILATESKPFGC